MPSFKNQTLENYINYLFVLYGFALPISRGAISILTALIFILWLFSNNFKQNIEFLKSNRVALYIIGFVGFSAVSLLWSQDVGSGVYYIRKYWYFLTIFAVATTIEKRYLELAISAFLTSMLISEIISYGIFFELWNYKGVTPEFPNPFMSHIQYSMFLAFTSLLLLNKIFHENSLNLKTLYALFFSTTTINLFINSGRTGQMAFVVSIFVVVFLNIKKRVLAFFTLLLFLSSLLYGAYIFSPNFKERVDVGVNDIKSILSKNDYSTSLGHRVGAWIIGVDIFIQNPILGIGITNEMYALKDKIWTTHRDKTAILDMPSYHNFYMQVAVHLGLVGLFLYLMIFYEILKLNIKDDYYYKMMVVFVSVYSVSSLVENMFHEQFPAAFFAFFTGIFMAQKRIKDEI